MNVLPDILNHPGVLSLGSWLLYFTWQGAVIALFLSLLLRIGRLASSEARYTACWIALGLMIALPTLSTLSALSVEKVDSLHVSTETVQPATHSTFLPELIVETDSFSQLSLIPWTLNSLTNLRAYLALTWMLGLLVYIFRLHLGLLSASRFKNSATNNSVLQLHPAVAVLCRKMNIQRPVAVKSSTQIDQPVLIGWLKPVVLLPASILTGLPSFQLEAILAHELAHVKRNDYLFSVLQSVMETLFFFHPAVWWISRQISIEREYCCDEIAVAVLSNKKIYLQTLADLEAHRMALMTPAFSLSMSDGSLLDRVKRITLASNQNPSIKSRTTIMGIALFICLSIFVTTGISQPFSSQQTPHVLTVANQKQVVDPPSLHPLKGNVKVTSGFGERYHPILKTRKMHNGIDFQAQIGSSVYATDDGTVKIVTENEGYGKYIVISHAGGFETVYTTLSTQDVEAGVMVKKGDKIGESGNTGQSTAPHLHYEVRLNGEAVDPADYLPEA